MGWLIGFIVGGVAAGAVVYLLIQKRHQQAVQRESAARAEQNRLAALRESLQAEYARKERELEQSRRHLASREAEFDKRFVTYDELAQENSMLKRDLQNIDVSLHKLRLDHELVAQQQVQLDERSRALAQRYLSETVQAVSAALTPNNFAAAKARLLDVIERCREIGFAVSADQEAGYVAELKAGFQRVVKAAVEREEQARIKAQVREEGKLQREIDRELEQIQRERLAIQAALDRALAEARDRHSEEVQLLQARLAEAEAKSQRALSMAQQTKAGNVYVISNIGSFGEGVLKIGMTRRLEPMDRIRELGDASVPFPYDVHMMIACDNAPALENAIHRALHKSRINRVNPRKEYFRADLDAIVQLVKKHHGDVLYRADPEALEYRQSLTISEADAEYIEQVYDAVTDDGAVVED